MSLQKKINNIDLKVGARNLIFKKDIEKITISSSPTETEIKGINIAYLVLKANNFHNLKITDVKIDKLSAESQVHGLDLSDSTIKESSFTRQKLQSINFSNTTFSGFADFSYCSFNGDVFFAKLDKTTIIRPAIFKVVPNMMSVQFQMELSHNDVICDHPITHKSPQ